MSLSEGWRKTTLGELVKVVDSLHKTPIYSVNGLYKMVRVTDIKRGKLNLDNCFLVDKQVFDEFSKKHLPSEFDIVFSRVGSEGIASLVMKNQMFCLGQNTVFIIPNERTSFLYYWLDSIQAKEEINARTTGSTQRTISLKSIKELEINLPPLQEQKAIASILSSFDEKIELLKEQNETLEKMAQVVFKEWLSEENNKNWEYKELNNVLDISSSKRIFSKEYVENGIPFYRSKEIIELSTKPNITTELFITEERFQEIKNKFSVPIRGDILLTSVGTLGVSYQVRDDKPFYFKDGNLTWFKNFSNVVSSDYIYLWLKLQSTQNKLNEVSIGSTQKALTINSLKTLKIPVLKDEKKAQELFNFIKIQLDKVNHNYEQIQTLQKTRDTLLPKLMSGELRVEEKQT